MDYEKMKILRKEFRDKYPIVEQFTDEELQVLMKMVNWAIEDMGGENGFEIIIEAITTPEGDLIDVDIIGDWLKKIQEALNMGGAKKTVYPNAIGTLLAFKKEYEDKNK